MLGRPKGGLKPRSDVDLFEDVVKVGFHRVLADAEFLGNLLVGGALHDHAENLSFAAGKNPLTNFFHPSGVLLNEVAHDPSGHPQFSTKDGPNAFGELLKMFPQVEKASDSLHEQGLFHACALFEIKKAQVLHARILTQQMAALLHALFNILPHAVIKKQK